MSVSTASEPELSRTAASATTVSASLVWLSFLVALAALLGSLWLSIGMGLKACPLCLYQRTFVMGVAAVLGVGFLIGPQQACQRQVALRLSSRSRIWVRG